MQAKFLLLIFSKAINGKNIEKKKLFEKSPSASGWENKNKKGVEDSEKDVSKYSKYDAYFSLKYFCCLLISAPLIHFFYVGHRFNFMIFITNNQVFDIGQLSHQYQFSTLCF